RESIDIVIATYGEVHSFTRSTIYGEFMSESDEEKYIISLASLQLCLQYPPRHKPGIKKVFCDFADGGAENVIAARDGNKIELVDCWRGTNKLTSVCRLITAFRQCGVKANEI